jgi:hypothetical protein
MTERGLQLADGLIIPGPCIFLEGEVLLWDVPEADKWENMSEKEIRERFEVFEVVVPRPGEWHARLCACLKLTTAKKSCCLGRAKLLRCHRLPYEST